MPVRRGVKLSEVPNLASRDDRLNDCVSLNNGLWQRMTPIPRPGIYSDDLNARIEARGYGALTVKNAKLVNDEYKAQVLDLLDVRNKTYLPNLPDLFPWTADRWRESDQEELNLLLDQAFVNDSNIQYATTIQDPGERQEYLLDDFFLPMLTAGSEANVASAWMCRPTIMMNYMELGYELNSWQSHKTMMVESVKEAIAELGGGARSLLPFVAVVLLGVIALKK